MKRLCLCLALLLTGCASEVAFLAPQGAAALGDRPFSVSGRLSVNMDGKGYVANFDWQHLPPRDELAVKTPLGNTVARVARGPEGVTLEADGKTTRAANVEDLTTRTLGWPLPLEGLAWWARGLPLPGVAQDRNEDGSLLQQGWNIRFLRDEGSVSLYPKRVDMSRAGLSIRVLMQDWH